MATAPDFDETLTTDDAQAIKEELIEAQVEALELGGACCLPDYKIRSIRKQYNDPREWLHEIILEIVKQTNPRPTWRLFVTALRNPTVGLPALSMKVERAYCSDTTPSHETEIVTSKPSAAESPPEDITVEVLEERIKRFHRRFNSIKMSTIECLEKCRIAIVTVVFHLTSILGLGEHKKFLDEKRRVLRKSKDHWELFEELNLYWSYLSFGLLASLLDELVVKNSEFLDIQREMAVYKEDMKKFRLSTTLGLFCKVAPSQGQQPPQGFYKMITRHNWPVTITLEDVEKFRRRFVCTFNLEDCAMMVYSVGTGSIKIIWFAALPPNILRLLKQSGTIKVLKDFQVTSVEIDEEIVYKPLPPPISPPATAFVKMEPFTEDTSQIYQPSPPPLPLPSPPSSGATGTTKQPFISKSHHPSDHCYTLVAFCHEKNGVPIGMIKGSATTDSQFAYFAKYLSYSLYRYEYTTEKWEELPECPSFDSRLAIINGELTTIGGLGSNKLMTLRQGKWAEKYPPMMIEQHSPALVTTSDDSYLFVVGGLVGFNWSTNVKLLQLKTRKWYTATALPKPLSHPSATICGDQLNVIARYGDGFSCSIQDLPSSDQPITSPLTLSWTPLPPTPVIDSTVATLCGQLVIIGGWQSWSPVNSIHQLVDGQWMEIGSMTRQRWRCQAVSPSPDKILIVGGVGALDSVEECIVIV